VPGTTPAMPGAAQQAALKQRFPDALLFMFPKAGHALERDFKWLGNHRYGIVHLHGQDDRNQVTNTPKDGTADRKRTDGPTSNTDERHQTGKHSTGNDARNSDGTDRADQKVGGDAARTVAGDDTRKADKDRTEQPTAGTHSKDKR